MKNDSEWANPVIVDNVYEQLEYELYNMSERKRGKIESVHFSFATDPFMNGRDDIQEMSLKIISLLNFYGLRVSLLTKGELPVEYIIEIEKRYNRLNQYGITLVSVDKEFYEKFEPGAAHPLVRVKHLEYLHNSGCYTWVNMEPYPTERLHKQDIVDVLNHVKFVDKIIFGQWNYSRWTIGQKAFYKKMAGKVEKFCIDNMILNCIIKEIK